MLEKKNNDATANSANSAKQADPPSNQRTNYVEVAGKVSRIGPVQYTPAGIAVIELTLAVAQRSLEKQSMGYVEAVGQGDIAERLFDQLRVGKWLSFCGSLWVRSFRNRQGVKVTETKVLIEEFGGIK